MSVTSNVLSIRDFELSFEAQGVSYLYETALYANYLPHKSVSIITNGVVQEYMHKDTLLEMNAVGLALTAELVQARIDSMNLAVENQKKSMDEILRNPLTQSTVQLAFASAGAVTHAYYFFDPHFFDGIFEEAEINPEAREVVRLVQEYKNVAREYFNQVHFGDSSDTAQLLRKLSAVSGVSTDDLQSYSENEIVALLGEVKVAPEMLVLRKKLYVLQSTEAGISVLLGREAEKFVAEFRSAKDSFSGVVLKGKVANAPQAIVRGVVKCVTRDYNDSMRMWREMDEMKQGEILVTQTTDPEMMPALRKASAAITDIGGMLSHTAITARELGIPCIVDTKFATQVLKDGDLVEVDADNGIVRIIK